MQPLMTVKEPEHVAPGPETDVFRDPCESHPGNRLAPRRVVDELVEGVERLRHPQDDPPLVELAQSG